MTDDQDQAADGLAALERTLERDLQLLNHPPDGWVRRADHRTSPGHRDVVILGGGMCGLTAAFALARLGIDDLAVLDARPAGFEGPWLSYARMRTLRSPKHLTGPALGLPSLTFRAWFEAQWGESQWQSLGRIPRVQWMDYLRWFRRVLRIPVENAVRVTAIHPRGDGFRLALERDGVSDTLDARKVVMATGREGMAHRRIPPAFAPLMGTRCDHSSDDIDFAALEGKQVAVIGLGASAFDNAGCALEAGARDVHLLARAEAMPRVNKAKSLGYAGFTHGFSSLTPQQRLSLFGYVARCRVAPPRSAVERVAAYENFHLHLASPVTAVREDGSRLVLDTPRQSVTVDHVILGTGFRIDAMAARELRPLAASLLRWRDLPGIESRGEAEEEFLGYPYLGDAFQCQARPGDDAPWAGNLHCFNLAAQISLGNVSSDIPAVSDGAERLARGIARDLFLAGAEQHLADLESYEEPELLGDEMDAEAWWPPL